MIVRLDEVNYGDKFIDRHFNTWIFVGLCPTVDGAGVFVGDSHIDRRAESIHLCNLTPFPSDGEIESVKKLLNDTGCVEYRQDARAYQALLAVRAGRIKS